jgi:hypothetical protein
MKAMSKTFFILQIVIGLALGVLTAFLLIHCSWDKPNPAAFTPVPGNPCGNVGVECGNHMCCDEGETCGGVGRSCPVDSCCDVRMPPSFLHYADSGIVTDRDAGQIVIVKGKQRPALP